MAMIKEDTSRLADEVHRLKDQRQEFITRLREEFVPGLKREVAILRGEFRTALGELSRSSEMNRIAFSSKLKDQVVGMLGGFREARIQMAHEKKADLQEYMSGLRKQISGLRQEMAGEMSETREIWTRLSSGRRNPAKKPSRK